MVQACNPCNSETTARLQFVSLLFYVCFFIVVEWPGNDKVSCSLDWFLICFIVKDDLELLILLHAPPQYWDYRHVPPHHLVSPRFHAYLTDTETAELHPKPRDSSFKASLGNSARLSQIKRGKQQQRQTKKQPNNKHRRGRLGI